MKPETDDPLANLLSPYREFLYVLNKEFIRDGQKNRFNFDQQRRPHSQRARTHKVWR